MVTFCCKDGSDLAELPASIHRRVGDGLWGGGGLEPDWQRFAILLVLSGVRHRRRLSLAFASVGKRSCCFSLAFDDEADKLYVTEREVSDLS